MCEYYSILYVFRIEPSTTVQRGAYDVCNKEAVRRINDCYFKLYSDHTTGACNCRGNGLGNPAKRWGSDVEKGKYALQRPSSRYSEAVENCPNGVGREGGEAR